MTEAKKDSLDNKKLDWSLLTIDMRQALEEVAKVLHYAAYDKPSPYGPRNWAKGAKDEGFKRELKSAIERHRTGAEHRYPYDLESKLHHRAHIVASELFLLSYDIAPSSHWEDQGISDEQEAPAPESSSNLEEGAIPWHEAPSWAQWAAMDKNGYWHWFEDKVTVGSDQGDIELIAVQYFEHPPFKTDWKDSLQQRPAPESDSTSEEGAIPWDRAPEWARWAAMDKNGEWFWYEHEPHHRGTCLWL